MVAKLRAELIQLDRDAQQAKTAHERALLLWEGALHHKRMLDRLSHFRNQRVLLDLRQFDSGAVGATRIVGSGERALDRALDLSAAADQLGMSEAEVRALGLHTAKGALVEDPAQEGAWVEEIETAEVLYLLLKRAPYARLRQVVDDLGVRVYIAPPWTKAERAERGFTPATERVTVRLLADPLGDGQHSPSVTNPSASV